MRDTVKKIFFILNDNSGNSDVNWVDHIKQKFSTPAYNINLYNLVPNCNVNAIKQAIDQYNPTIVVAVGGDGTVNLAAECLLNTSIPLAILPAGSANGMAKELGIETDPQLAIENIIQGNPTRIHLIKINDKLCIHLSDMGFNAYVVKKFEAESQRGMWGYVKAAFKALYTSNKMQVNIVTKDGTINQSVAMLVIANATQYGTGVTINPKGCLTDDLFEVVLIKKISFTEIFKMRFTGAAFDRSKTELLSTSSLTVTSAKKMHFQIDGEYLGKVNKVKAEIITNAIYLICPPPQN